MMPMMSDSPVFVALEGMPYSGRSELQDSASRVLAELTGRSVQGEIDPCTGSDSFFHGVYHRSLKGEFPPGYAPPTATEQALVQMGTRIEMSRRIGKALDERGVNVLVGGWSLRGLVALKVGGTPEESNPENLDNYQWASEAMGVLVPDMTVILEIDHETFLERSKHDPRLGIRLFDDKTSFDRYQQGYLEMARLSHGENHKVVWVNAKGSFDQAARRLSASLEAYLPDRFRIAPQEVAA